MYLKSMELMGFKSFANKIVLKFHNGITGIVGPNGSGKSNIADAVRWVLGEQSAKTLRSSAMTDVIFSGTEARKPLSYAYVAITLDNSDHVLPIEFDEVTVARRVYRSGESEYLINGAVCRLRDVTELFYDTGIGKEGYSIIGQGQIDKILSGRPEERRELFDEAVGIVKYKKRKTETIKKLSDEEESLVRINDILGELERQREPLKKQAELAREYLSKRDRLRQLDIDSFILESDAIGEDQRKTEENRDLVKSQLDEGYKKSEQIKESFHRLKEEAAEREKELDGLRESKQALDVENEKKEGRINLLREQLKYQKQSSLDLEKRKNETLDSIAATEALIKEQEEKLNSLEGDLSQINEREQETDRLLTNAKRSESELANDIETIKKASDEVSSFMSRHQAMVMRNKTLKEQLTLQKSQIAGRMLSRQAKNKDLADQIRNTSDEDQALLEKLSARKKEIDELVSGREATEKEREALKKELKEKTEEYNVSHARLESIRNIAERYEGFGNTVKSVMDKKRENPGIYGVVADLLSTDKKYETAIEIALGGSVKNIVVDTEDTAKGLIAYLKRERLGRATFLPVSMVHGNARVPEAAMSERGVIGTADDLIRTDSRYKGIFSYLLGRYLVVDNIDSAVALQKKYRNGLSIVTLDGDTIRPGGAMTGGAFRRSDNLLGRKRQLDDLSDKCRSIKERLFIINESMDASTKKREEEAALEKEKREEYNALLIEKKNIEHDLTLLKEQQADQTKAYEDIVLEEEAIKKQLKEMEAEQSSYDEKLSEIHLKEKDISVRSSELEKEKSRIAASIERLSEKIGQIRIEKASLTERINAAGERLSGLKETRDTARGKIEELESRKDSGSKETEAHNKEIEELYSAIEEGRKQKDQILSQIESTAREKEELDRKSQTIFDQSEDISQQISLLEKESVKINTRLEKNKERSDELNNYMWDQYELTRHEAERQKSEKIATLSDIRSESKALKSDIRSMGSVNVNAVEEYDELSKRYDFMSSQHDDLMNAREKLLALIEDLDKGMTDQFNAGFKDIQTEFDKAFKELFGGGHGRITLDPDQNVLEAGINIIASPPGKRLTNMMQLSGGEKALTAIALLFAIQNLHPSPFCLLDEIEAALDDSNVDRFASYLGRLTSHTQFIVITHRRGTMNAADRLYGITMQEKGVSTLVSVNLIEDQLT
ncbi:MAG: chromosome segregation protein SMC [Lachnospiraceae bacterium]|nr:chromosome segregation protein SMC [Lachnospiraceae bacterium]